MIKTFLILLICSGLYSQTVNLSQVRPQKTLTFPAPVYMTIEVVNNTAGTGTLELWNNAYLTVREINYTTSQTSINVAANSCEYYYVLAFPLKQVDFRLTTSGYINLFINVVTYTEPQWDIETGSLDTIPVDIISMPAIEVNAQIGAITKVDTITRIINPVTVTGTVAFSNASIQVSNFPSSFNVGNFPATQNVNVTNSSLAVTGTFWQATQPVSGTVAFSNATIAVTKQGSWIDSTTILNFPAVQNVSLGNNTGKTNVFQLAQITTTSATADQVIRTYTVTSGKTLYLMGFSISARLTAFNNIDSLHGSASLEIVSGTKVFTQYFSQQSKPNYNITFPEPVPITAGTVVRLVCTPPNTASRQWTGNFYGYEK